MAWLPDDFAHPERADLPTGEHLRPIRADDVATDYPAVMGSRERLWAKYGEVWGWPPESELLGCVYIDPPDERSAPGSDAVASWWVVDYSP